jgi:multisubunit Na+/H+ antiporter MnhB subunit
MKSRSVEDTIAGLFVGGVGLITLLILPAYIWFSGTALEYVLEYWGSKNAGGPVDYNGVICHLIAPLPFIGVPSILAAIFTYLIDTAQAIQ